MRDNVIFELGLFVGHIGKDRCFILIPDNSDELRIPTDLIGMTSVEYETVRTALKLDPEDQYAHERLALSMKLHDEELKKLSKIVKEVKEQMLSSKLKFDV